MNQYLYFENHKKQNRSSISFVLQRSYVFIASNFLMISARKIDTPDLIHTNKWRDGERKGREKKKKTCTCPGQGWVSRYSSLQLYHYQEELLWEPSQKIKYIKST